MNTNTTQNERLKPCECRWCVAAQRRDRMQMDGMVIAPCDEYGRTDREAMPSLTERIDLDELAALLAPYFSGADRAYEEHYTCADAVLAALPELMGGEQA